MPPFAQTLQLQHLPPSVAVHAALFTNLENANFLREQLLAGNAAFEFAMVDASSLVSTTHALAAVYRAVYDLLNHRLRTRNVHSETVFALSPTNNIADSFRRFGITDKTTHLLCIKVSHPGFPTTLQEWQCHLAAHVKARQIDFCDREIASLTEWPAVHRVYKLNLPGGKPVNTATDAEKADMEVTILGIMALKGS